MLHLSGNHRYRPAICAGLAAIAVAAGCSFKPDLPGYSSTPSAQTLAAGYPALIPQDVFAAELAQASSGFDPAQAETEALLARAAALRARGAAMMKQ
ncbi:MAG: hypothetical protein ACE5FS_02675 [Paracoccaceae bacterium]